MIKITLPDGNVREFKAGVTGMEIAEAISSRLAREVLSVSVNGEVWDLGRPITADALVKLYTWEEREGKETFWHTSAHLMAQAIEEFYPGTLFGIGPTVDNGFYYDIDLPGGQQLSEKELEKIEKRMMERSREKQPVVRQSISKAEAIRLFTEKGDPLKLELISELEDGTITLYSQGQFTDLCRGPHLPDTGYIKAVKLTAIAGAYWRGNEKNKMLTRVYGITFPKQKMLEEYLVMIEEAKKRDHRKIGKEMELFTFSEAVGLGLPLWLPKGAQLRGLLEDFLRKIQKNFGYDQVITPPFNIDLIDAQD
ncbi:MAG TPA: TGS domain-containing protein, partial [Prolixibacteraceae bacterium]|nr:TGS domain-containing protein [Prolixibacteraceae bacterium]